MISNSFFVLKEKGKSGREKKRKRKMRPVFCGNFEYETRQSDLERLFSKYGRVERVDMKSGNYSIFITDV